jgi:hypothetical protein
MFTFISTEVRDAFLRRTDFEFDVHYRKAIFHSAEGIHAEEEEVTAQMIEASPRGATRRTFDIPRRFSMIMHARTATTVGTGTPPEAGCPAGIR